MSRVVASTVLGPGPHRLAAVPRDEVDPVVRELLDRATSDAYERGVLDGHRLGVAETEARAADGLEQLAAAIAAAAGSAAREVRAACDDVVESVFELALGMAAAILDHEPTDGGAAVAARIRAALALMEEPAPVIEVATADEPFVAAALADLRTVSVEACPSLAPGEARIRGGWAAGDLTREAAFAAIRRELRVRD